VFIRGKSLLLLLALLVAATPALAKKPIDEVDYVALAALLVRDGEYDRAEDAIAKADPAAEGIDLARYHTVRGMIALERQKPGEAVDAFAAAIAAGQDDPLIHLLRAQANFGLERYEAALEALDVAGDSVQALSGAWLLRAHAYWMTGQRQACMETLSQATERFPGNTGFLRRQVFYLVDAGLYREAGELGREYLRRAEGKAEDYVAIGTALRRSKSFDEALRFLESAQLKFPQDGNVAKALAQTWLESGKPLAAAELLARQAEFDAGLLPEAAELFRRAGHPARALQLNTRVTDSPRKLKQRVGLLVELGRFDQVAAMEAPLLRAGLMGDEDIRYALAYAFFKASDFDAAERHLQALTRPELFRRATELRRLMAECADARWLCS
jgi:tetratricopeptide (TPR) repeat protein